MEEGFLLAIKVLRTQLADMLLLNVVEDFLLARLAQLQHLFRSL